VNEATFRRMLKSFLFSMSDVFTVSRIITNATTNVQAD